MHFVPQIFFVLRVLAVVQVSVEQRFVRSKEHHYIGARSGHRDTQNGTSSRFEDRLWCRIRRLKPANSRRQATTTVSAVVFSFRLFGCTLRRGLVQIGFKECTHNGLLVM